MKPSFLFGCMSEKGVSAPIFIESGNAVDQFTYLKFMKIIGMQKTWLN